MAHRKKVTMGSHHQGDTRYGIYAGTQCVANVQSFFLYSEQIGVHTMGKSDIDNVLSTGNNIYLSARKRSTVNYLLPTDLPHVIGEGFWRCNINPLSMFYGNICDDIVDLCASLNQAFQVASTLYFTAKDSCVGLKKVGERYYVFDSHARNRSGFTDAYGKACIIYFPKFYALAKYLEQQYGDVDLQRFQIVACKVDNLPDDYSHRQNTFVDESSYSVDQALEEHVVSGSDVIQNGTGSLNQVTSQISSHCSKTIEDQKAWKIVTRSKGKSSPKYRGQDGYIKLSVKNGSICEENHVNYWATLEKNTIGQCVNVVCHGDDRADTSFSKVGKSSRHVEGLLTQKKSIHVNSCTTKTSSKGKLLREGLKKNKLSPLASAASVKKAKIQNTKVSKDYTTESVDVVDMSVNSSENIFSCETVLRETGENIPNESSVSQCQSTCYNLRKRKRKQIFPTSDVEDLEFEERVTVQPSTVKASKHSSKGKGTAIKANKQSNKSKTIKNRRVGKNRSKNKVCFENETIQKDSQCEKRPGCKSTGNYYSQNVRWYKQRYIRQKKASGELLLTTGVSTESTGNVGSEDMHENALVVENNVEISPQLIQELNEGCYYICCACEQIYFRRSVTEISYQRLSLYKQYIDVFDETRSHSTYYICSTCKLAISSGKIARLSRYNGMAFPDIPEQLEITPKEASLISPRIVFLNLHALPKGCQMSLYGNVISVPADIEASVCSLPRHINAEGTVSCRIKRRLRYKSVYRHINVRPERVMCALHWLLQNSELYQQSDIQIDTQWLQDTINELRGTHDVWTRVSSEHISGNDENGLVPTGRQEGTNEFSNSTSCCNEERANLPQNNVEQSLGNSEECTRQESGNNSGSDDNFSEVDPAEYNALLPTLLDEEVDTQYLDVAPGEGNFPRNVFFDTHGEELAFPVIYSGMKMSDLYPNNIKLSERLRWELRNRDRRVAQNAEKIFFMYKKYQINYIFSKRSFAVRLLKNKKYRTCDVNDVENLKKIAGVNDGFFFFKNLRNSPMYLNSKKSDLQATIRQLGIPTWFLSLSSADTHWKGLLQCLAKLGNNTDLSEEDIENLSFQDRCKLLNGDPVTAARYFDNRMSFFLRHIIYNSSNPIGCVVDHFYKIEFQHRGSPHVHMLIFTSDRPEFSGSDDCNALADYIDKYVSVSVDVDSQTQDLVRLQTHRHSRTCRKGGKKICRFNFPMPPMRTTRILNASVDPTLADRNNYERIKDLLTKDEERIKTFSFDDLLSELNLSEEEYCQAISSSLQEDKLFLKRTPAEIRINPYMINLILVWRANHDIQFCLNIYSVVTYIVSYIQKTNRGLSLALSKIREEHDSDPHSIRDQVKAIGDVFLNASEVSVQECVYMLLGLPMCHMSREVYFINTSPKEERIKVLKGKADLENLNPNSTDVCFKSLYEKYAKRPKRFEDWCLADFATKLRLVYHSSQYVPDEDEPDEIRPVDNNEGVEEEEILMTCRYFEYKLRRKRKILKYHVPKGSNREESLNRIHVLLFLPWRDEDFFLNNYESFTHFITEISESEKKKLSANLEEYNQVSSTLLEELDRDVGADGLPDGIAPSTEYEDQLAQQEMTISLSGEDFFIPEPVNPSTSGNQIDDETYQSGINVSSGAYELVENIWPQEKILDTVNTLNFKQRCIYDHVMKHIITTEENLHLCITGGAGVGKSVVLRLLHNSLSRYYNLNHDYSPNIETVKCVAFTGKAAFLINGETLHHCLGIPPNRNYMNYIPLNADRLNTLRMNWQHVKVVLIDEISLVGAAFLYCVNRRLQDIYGSKKPFGGVHIISFGDFFQLLPVCDRMVFQPPKGALPALGTIIWTKYFKYFELTQIMRQQGDVQFAEALNRFRKGVILEQDITMIKSREISLDLSRDNIPQILCGRNDQVDEYNKKLFDRCTQQKTSIVCRDKIIGNVLEKNMASIISKISDDPKKTGSLSKVVDVGVNLMYDIIVNVDVKDGLANGTTGQVKWIETLPGCTKPYIIWFDFKDPSVGKKQKLLYKDYYKNHVQPEWVPITAIVRKFNVGAKFTEIARTQFPIKQSGAKTVHKSQGCTVDSVIVHITGQFQPYMRHMMYVALSRVTSLEGLHVINFDRKYIRAAQDVLQEDHEASTTRKCKLNYTLFTEESLAINLYYENSQSLKSHFRCLLHHNMLKHAHIVMLTESRLKRADNSLDYILPGYELLRMDQASCERPSGGIVVYVHSSVKIIRMRNYQADGVEMIAIHVEYLGLQEKYIVLYKHPGICNASVIQALNTLELGTSTAMPTVLIGDFNINALLPENNVMIGRIQNSTGLILQDCDITTKAGSQIDLVFSNKSIICQTHFIPWSLHFGISCIEAPQ